MRIALLGSLQVDDGRTTLGPRDRLVLQALACRPGSVLSTEALAETLWGEDEPETWQKVVQGCIVRLRKALGAEAILTSPNGYRLVMHQDELDHVHFEHLITRARELLANGEPERALFVTGQARELWRGEPLVELADWGPGRVEAERLTELWRDAEDLHAEAALRSGRHQEVMGDVLRMVAEQPTRERRWGLLALAQYQAGRQGDALQTLHRAKATLVHELGLDPGPELAQLEQAILRQDPSLAAQSVLPPATTTCPYLGLVAYDVTDAPAFFGREADIAACLRRLDETGVLVVVGPSGCGKSSVTRAGVAAALERDGRRVTVLTPGAHPADSLAATGYRYTDVLVVDQCEEALALDSDSPERVGFFDRLTAFRLKDGALVISIRADRLGELSAHPEFARHVEPGLYLLGAMAEAALRRAIEGPAAQAGLRLEPGLVDLLVREVQGEPAALPLLSHVLRQTWERREGNTLTVAGYSATGGIREAISQSAESLFRELRPGQQEVLRDLMVRLVAPDDLGEPVRQRVPRRSVASDADHTMLIERLVGARLLSTDGDTVEIAHEALAVTWPRLRSWLDDDVDGLRIMRHLSVAATSWDDLGRPDSELYRGVRQARAAEWHERAGAALTDTERDFLHASAALADKEQRATEAQVRRERRLNQRLRAGLAAVAALLALSIVAGALALTARNTADRAAAAIAKQARAADARRLGAEALRTEDLDRSLLLAAAGVRLDNSSDTRASLLATLDRGPALTRTGHSAGHLLSVAVDPATDRVATTAADGVGLELYDGHSLTRIAIPEHLSTGSVFADPDGSGFAVSITADLVKAGTEPPVVLLNRAGARSAVQLGGFPKGYQVYDNFGFDPSSRWNMGYDPGGRWFAASLRDIGGTRPDLTLVWDLRAPSHPAARFALPDGKAPMVSTDGRTLYSMSNDQGRLVVTNLPGGTPRRVLTGADLGVHQLDPVLVESPDGRTLAIGAGVEAVLVDAATLKPKTYVSGQGATSALAFSWDGTRLAATGDRLLVWDVSGAHPVPLLNQAGPVDDPQFSRDATTVFTKTFAGVLEAWDLAGTHRFIAAQPGQHLAWKEGFDRISPDGRKVAYVQLGPRFRVRDLVTGVLGPLVTTPMPQGSYLDIAWHPDSTIINMTTGDPVVRTWDSRTGRQIAQRRLAPPPSTEGAALAFFSLDGKYLLVGTTAGRIHVLDAHTLVPAREPIQVYPAKKGKAGQQDVYDLTPSGDLHTAYLNDAIVDYVSGQVRHWPALGSKVLSRFPSPDGRRLLIGTETGTGLLDATTMRWISPPNAAQARLVGGGTKFSDDGSLVASVSNGRLSHWDGRTGAYLGSASVDWDGDPAFSKDDSQLLFAGETGTVMSWNLDPASWVAAACRIAGRDLTPAEWRTYVPARPFVPVCAS
jgi:DNA-binding SARP family transcriptional activator/WD40 repeat protein/energy-coupling factor transporter ATP-binding protein EcfA2